MLAAWQGVACDGVITFTSANARLQLSTSYTLTGRKVVLDASGLSSGVTLLAAPASRHFRVTGSTANLTAKAITFQNGRINMTSGNARGGSLFVELGGSGYLEDCVFRNNSVTSSSLAEGGAIYASGSGAIVLRRSVLLDNVVTAAVQGNGGAVFISTVTMPIVFISSRLVSNRVVVSEVIHMTEVDLY